MRVHRILISRTTLVVVAGVLLASVARTAAGQAGGRIPSGPVQTLDTDFQPSFASSFDRLWRRYVEVEASGQKEQSERILEEIRRLRLERNVFHLHGVALAFAYRGAARLASGDIEEAERQFRVSRELDSTLLTAHQGLALVARRSGVLGIVSYVDHSLGAAVVSFRSPSSGGYARANLLIWLAVTLLAVGVIFAAAMLYRYAGPLHHDLMERFAERIGETGTRSVTLGLLLLPLVMTLGAAWVPPYWLAVTFAYQSRAERAISSAILVLLLVSAPFVEFHSGWTKTIVNPVYRAAISSIDGRFEPTDLLVLQEAVRQSPNDRDLRFLVATQYKNLGEYDLAANRYREILDEWPDDLGARVNLGNVYFTQRDWDGAILEYTRAIEAHPDSGLAFYNKSLAHAENFQFRERELARATAEDLDRRAVASHERRTGDYRTVVQVRLEPDVIFAKFYGLEEGVHSQPAFPSWTAALAGGQGKRLAWGAVLLGLLILVLQRVAPRPYTRRCWKCGTSFCGRCQIGTGRRGLCTPCYHLFFVKDGVSAEARNQKLSQVKKTTERQSLWFRVFSIVAPGLGHIVGERPLIGTGLLIPWFGGLSYILMEERFYQLPDRLMGLGTSVPMNLVIGILVAAWLIANTAFRPELRG